MFPPAPFLTWLTSTIKKNKPPWGNQTDAIRLDAINKVCTFKPAFLQKSSFMNVPRIIGGYLNLFVQTLLE